MRQDLLETLLPVMDIAITVPVGDIPMAGHGVPITAEFRDHRNDFETVHGMPVYDGEDINDSDCETPGQRSG